MVYYDAYDCAGCDLAGAETGCSEVLGVDYVYDCAVEFGAWLCVEYVYAVWPVAVSDDEGDGDVVGVLA